MPPATRPSNPRRTARPTAPPSLRIAHENLDDKIYARVKVLIAERRMLPGERILQDRLAREMGVSRTPLVNALKRLAHAMGSVNMRLFAYQDGLVRPAAETVEEHFAILGALGRKDPDASEAAMRLHIRRSVEQLEKAAEAEEAQAE